METLSICNPRREMRFSAVNLARQPLPRGSSDSLTDETIHSMYTFAISFQKFYDRKAYLEALTFAVSTYFAQTPSKSLLSPLLSATSFLEVLYTARVLLQVAPCAPGFISGAVE